MADLATRAQQLLDLHHSGTTLVLPTVWDAWSANAVVAAGFPALTIGSHPLADSRGQGDNEAMSLDDALDGIRRITAAVDVPVSADMESGYDTAAHRTRRASPRRRCRRHQHRRHRPQREATALCRGTRRLHRGTSVRGGRRRSPTRDQRPHRRLLGAKPRRSMTHSPKRSVVCERARTPAPGASTRSGRPMPPRCGHCSTSSRDRST